jgi:hypothetical protein
MQVRSLLRTGWGPRGDSGSARGRVRATQPASFCFRFPRHFRPEPTKENVPRRPPFSFTSIGIPHAIYGKHVRGFLHVPI